MRDKRFGRTVLFGSVGIALVGLVLGLPGCEKRSKHVVQVRYVQPPKVGMPEGLEAIAFIPFSQAIEDKDNLYSAKEKKWGDHVVSAVASRMEEYSREFNIPLRIVDRDAVAAIMKEKDLADAGLAEENKALQLGKLAQAQAICYGKVAINIRTVRGSAKTIKLRRSGYGLTPYTETKESLQRTITVASSMKLVAVATGRSLLTFTKTRSQTVKRKPGLFMGEDASEDQLQPEDQAIRDLLEEMVEEFVAQLMPHKVVADVRLAKAKNKNAESATRLIMTGEYDEAISLLKESLDAESDDHGAWYNLGVAYELAGKPDQALKCYSTAYRISDKDLYLTAHTRLKKMVKSTKQAKVPAK